MPPIDVDLPLRILAERAIRWPVAETLRQRGFDVDWFREMNIAGVRAQLDAHVTPTEIDNVVTAILDGRPPYE